MTGSPVWVLVAPDKFKGSLTALEVAAALGRGVRRAAPDLEVVEHPVADGGEGTVEMMLAQGFTAVPVEVPGPLGDPVRTVFAMNDDTAVLEMASAAGLALLAGDPDPTTARTASTYGVGRLLVAALDRGARRVVIGVGGSATTDGAAGALEALGVRLADAEGRPVRRGGAGLVQVDLVDLTGLDPRVRDLDVVVACDVDNPLTGPVGAAAVYGPQKGAGSADVATLDRALGRFADAVAEATGADGRDEPGAGAAGGLAFGLAAVLGARMTPGIDLLLGLTGFDAQVRGASLVVVGEGSFDAQSLRGKGPVGVAQAATRLGVPAVAVAGVSLVSADAARAVGIDAVYALSDLEPDPARSMRDAASLLERVGERLAVDRGLAPGA